MSNWDILKWKGDTLGINKKLALTRLLLVTVGPVVLLSQSD